ncbi:hypothetical protein ACU686_27705 [Yinghuangia aomiensis]
MRPQSSALARSATMAVPPVFCATSVSSSARRPTTAMPRALGGGGQRDAASDPGRSADDEDRGDGRSRVVA